MCRSSFQLKLGRVEKQAKTKLTGIKIEKVFKNSVFVAKSLLKSTLKPINRAKRAQLSLVLCWIEHQKSPEVKCHGKHKLRTLIFDYALVPNPFVLLGKSPFVWCAKL